MTSRRFTRSWTEIQSTWKGQVSETNWTLVKSLSSTFDEVWLQQQADLLQRERTAHHLYRWLVAPMNIQNGGGDRLYRLATAIRLLEEHAFGKSWDKKREHLQRRLKSYSPDAHFAFFDLEFEVFQIAKLLAREANGVKLIDLEYPLPNGKSADALVEVDSKRVLQEFRALERSGEDLRMNIILFDVLRRLRETLPSPDLGYELHWKVVPSDDHLESFFESLAKHRDELQKPGASLDLEVASIGIRESGSKIGWHPTARKSRMRILSQLVGARNKFEDVHDPILLKVKLYWSDDRAEQLEQAKDFLNHPKSAIISGILIYDYDAFEPQMHLPGRGPKLTETEVQRLA